MVRIYLICLVFDTLLYKLCYAQYKPWQTPPLRYIDYDIKEIYFDRVVFFTLDVANYIGDNRTNKHICSGVLIDNQRVLTSYNALRNLTKSIEMLDLIYVCYLISRRVIPGTPERPITQYAYECGKVQCGRPVVPMEDDELEEELWHGPDKKHSPLHDLMVVRLEEPLDIWVPEKNYTYEERHTPEDIKNGVIQRAGPLITTLAKSDDKFRSRIEFVSLGLTSQRNIRRYFGLELAEFEDTDNVETDCDDWLPRSWGYFICLANDDDKYPGFASGALLFSRRKLFGVGSFTLSRGKQSIIVFTDIRYYLEHINLTCTDQDLV